MLVLCDCVAGHGRGRVTAGSGESGRTAGSGRCAGAAHAVAAGTARAGTAAGAAGAGTGRGGAGARIGRTAMKVQDRFLSCNRDDHYHILCLIQRDPKEDAAASYFHILFLGK